MNLREAERRQRQREHPILRVIPFIEWCELRGISPSTGRRLVHTGKVKITQLSVRRIGVREDHDQQYLDSCARGGV
jgi:predicted site-specific integrase-resolvase